MQNGWQKLWDTSNSKTTTGDACHCFPALGARRLGGVNSGAAGARRDCAVLPRAIWTKRVDDQLHDGRVRPQHAAHPVLESVRRRELFFFSFSLSI